MGHVSARDGALILYTDRGGGPPAVPSRGRPLNSDSREAQRSEDLPAFFTRVTGGNR